MRAARLLATKKKKKKNQRQVQKSRIRSAHNGLNLYEMDAFHVMDKNLFPANSGESEKESKPASE